MRWTGRICFGSSASQRRARCGRGSIILPLLHIRSLRFIHTYYLPTYLLTSWSRVLLDNATGSHLVEKFPAFYGTGRFITEFTSARQLSLYWAASIKTMPSHPTSWRFILILSSHLCLSFRHPCLRRSVTAFRTCGHFLQKKNARQWRNLNVNCYCIEINP